MSSCVDDHGNPQEIAADNEKELSALRDTGGS